MSDELSIFRIDCTAPATNGLPSQSIVVRVFVALMIRCNSDVFGSSSTAFCTPFFAEHAVQLQSVAGLEPLRDATKAFVGLGGASIACVVIYLAVSWTLRAKPPSRRLLGALPLLAAVAMLIARPASVGAASSKSSLSRAVGVLYPGTAAENVGCGNSDTAVYPGTGLQVAVAAAAVAGAALTLAVLYTTLARWKSLLAQQRGGLPPPSSAPPPTMQQASAMMGAASSLLTGTLDAIARPPPPTNALYVPQPGEDLYGAALARWTQRPPDLEVPVGAAVLPLVLVRPGPLSSRGVVWLPANTPWIVSSPMPSLSQVVPYPEGAPPAFPSTFAHVPIASGRGEVADACYVGVPVSKPVAPAAEDPI